MNEIDNETKNEIEPTAMRECAAMLAEEGYTNAADYMRRKANALDPPKPKPGTYVWCLVDGCEWELAEVTSSGLMIFGSSNIVLWEEVERYKRAYILKPGQVAVDRQVVVCAEYLLRSELYTCAADRLQAALNRDTEANHG